MKRRKSTAILSLALALTVLVSFMQLPVIGNAASATKSFGALADTFVAQGAPKDVYQADKYLYLRSQPSQVRKSYLKFDLSEIAGSNVSSAVLGVYNAFENSGAAQVEYGTVKISAVSDINWDPATLCWNNMAAGIDESDIQEVTLYELTGPEGQGYNRYYEVDLTEFINNCETKQFTLILEDADGKILKFASNEYGEGTAPYLKVEYEKVNIPVSGISIQEDSIDLRTGDDPYALDWAIDPFYASNKNVTWTSSNPSAATVVNGIVTPVGVGTSTITVTTEDGNKSDSCTVNVSLGRVVQTLLSSADTYIAEGDPEASFQNAQYLYARSTGGNSNEIYLNFDATELDMGAIVGAYLNLYYFKDESSQATIDGSAVDGGELPVYGLKATNWYDTTNITWKENVPSSDGAVSIGNLKVDSEANGGFDQFYRIDVTDYVVSKGDGLYAFKIQGDNASQKAYKFRSNNFSAENGDCRPYLTFLCNPDGIAVDRITLNHDSLSLDTSSEDVQLEAVIEPYNASNQTIKWTTSNDKVVTVSKNGLVSVTGVGSATITAACDGKSAACNVTVAQGRERRKVYTVVDTFIDEGDKTKAQDTSATLYCRNYGGATRASYLNFDCSYYADKTITGAKLYLYYYKDPAIFTNDGGSLPVTGLMDTSWAENASVITFDNAKQFISEAQTVPCGNLEIAGGKDGGFDRYYSVDVSDYVKAMSGTDFSFKVEGQKDANLAYKFRSSDYADQTQAPYLEIYYNPTGIDAQSVVLDKTSLELETGDAAVQLNATVLPEYVSKPNVTWKSSNPSVATVSAAGLVTPVSAGDAVITATSGDGKKSATCTVRVDNALPSTKIPVVMDCFADGGDKTHSTGSGAFLYARTGTARTIYLKVDMSEVDTSKAVHSAALNLYYFKDTSSQATIDVSAVDGGTLPVYGIYNNIWDESTLNWNTGRPDANGEQVEFIDNLVVDSEANGGFDKFYSVDILPFFEKSTDGVITLRIDGDAAISKAYKFRSSNFTDSTMHPYVEVKYAPEGVPVTGVTLDRSALVMDITDAPVKLTAKLNPKYPSNANVIWSSSDESVATVSNTGLVTPVAGGTAVITVKTEDGGYTADCVVTVAQQQVGHRLGMQYDTYVNGLGTGGARDEAFNESTQLYVRADKSNNQTRAAYLKTQDYSNLDKSKIKSATLYLTRAKGTLETNEDAMVDIYGITNDWEETIVWADQPIPNGVPSEDNAKYLNSMEIPMNAAGPEYDAAFSADITRYLKNNKENTASFLLVSEKPYYFHSTEAVNAAYRPYIVIEMADEATMKTSYRYGSGNSWVTGGSMIVDATISSGATAGLSNITVLCAIYEKDTGKMTGLVKKTAAVAASGDTKVSLTYENLPGSADEYYVKVMAWEDTANISPIVDSSIILAK